MPRIFGGGGVLLVQLQAPTRWVKLAGSKTTTSHNNLTRGIAQRSLAARRVQMRNTLLGVIAGTFHRDRTIGYLVTVGHDKVPLLRLAVSDQRSRPPEPVPGDALPTQVRRRGADGAPQLQEAGGGRRIAVEVVVDGSSRLRHRRSNGGRRRSLQWVAGGGFRVRVHCSIRRAKRQVGVWVRRVKK